MIREQVSRCGQKLRLGRQAEASSLLMALLESVGEPLEWLPADRAHRVQRSLARALNYQQSQDLIALADELEYVLLPLVEVEPAISR